VDLMLEPITTEAGVVNYSNSHASPLAHGRRATLAIPYALVTSTGSGEDISNVHAPATGRKIRGLRQCVERGQPGHRPGALPGRRADLAYEEQIAKALQELPQAALCEVLRLVAAVRDGYRARNWG
jgi:hypothetical protein